MPTFVRGRSSALITNKRCKIYENSEILFYFCFYVCRYDSDSADSI